MIKRGLIAGGMVLGLVVAVYLVPRMMNWNRYRTQISVLAANRLGRPVSITGDVRLTILPHPELVAQHVSVTDTVTGATFTATDMRLQVGLLALLAGRLDPRTLDLDGAALNLPWPMAPGGFKMRPPIGFAAHIRHASLIVGYASISNIDATLATDGDEGDVSVTGTGRLGQVNWAFTGKLSAVEADRQSAVSLLFTGLGPADGAVVRLEGRLGAEGAFAGNLTASGPDLSRVLLTPHGAFGIEAKIQAAGDSLTGSDVALELGGADGRGSFRWQAGNPAFALQLVTTRLDLDGWKHVWLQPASNGISVRFDIKADAATLAGGTLRNLHIDVERGYDTAAANKTNRLILHEFTATLPGETAFSAHGAATSTGANAWHLDQGDFSLKTGDLAPSLSWLAAMDTDLPNPPGRSPLPADLTGKIEGYINGPTDGTLNISALLGHIGGDAVAGTAGYARTNRSRVTADLTVNQLPLAPFTALNLSPKLDYDLSMTAKQASLGRITAQNVAFRLSHDQTGTKLANAQATWAGIKLTASLSELSNGQIATAAIDGDAPNLTGLLANAPSGWNPTKEFVAQPLHLSGRFAGPTNAVGGHFSLNVGDTHLTLLPTLDVPEQTIGGALTLRDPGAWRLAARMGWPAEPWLGVGSLGLIARFRAKPDHLAVNYLDLALGGMRLKGGFSFDLTGDQWALNGQLVSDRLPLAWPQWSAQTQIPTNWIKGGSGKISLSASNLVVNDAPVGSDFHVDLGLGDGVLSWNNFAVNWGGGSIKGSGAWHALDAQPSVNLQAQLNKIALPGPLLGGSFDLLAGNVSGQLSLTAQGHSRTTMLATLNGNADVTVRDGKLSGFDLAAARAAVGLPGILRPPAVLLAALRRGKSNFNALHIIASIKDGGLTVEGGNLDEARLSGQADLPGSAIDLTMALHLPDGAPPVTAHYKGPWAAPGVNVDMAGFKKWLPQRQKAKAKAKAKAVAKAVKK